MARKRKTSIRPQINPAVAALGVGVQPGKWTPRSIIEAMERRYIQLIQIGEDAIAQNRSVRGRMHYAAAYEMAQFIAGYHQENSTPEEYTKWEHRKNRSNFLAFATRNQIAESIGAGSDAPTPSEDGD